MLETNCQTNCRLEAKERVTCEVYGLERCLLEKYTFYQDHVETYKVIFDAMEKMPEDKIREVCRALAKLVGDKADLDLDFQRKLKNDNIKGNDALKLKQLLGMLAVEYYLSGTIPATAG